MYQNIGGITYDMDESMISNKFKNTFMNSHYTQKDKRIIDQSYI